MWIKCYRCGQTFWDSEGIRLYTTTSQKDRILCLDCAEEMHLVPSRFKFIPIMLGILMLPIAIVGIVRIFYYISTYSYARSPLP